MDRWYVRGIYDTSSGVIDQKYRFAQKYTSPPAVSKDGQLFVTQESFALLNMAGQSIKIELTVPAQNGILRDYLHVVRFGLISIMIFGCIEQRMIQPKSLLKEENYPRHIQTSGPWIYWVEDDSIRGWNCESAEYDSIAAVVVDRIAT